MRHQIKWSIDEAHSEIAFKIRHLMIVFVKGTFKTFNATVYTCDKDFKTANIDLWIDASSITTGDAKRDEHLKAADFFDVHTHTQIRFTSNTMGPADRDGNYELPGKLMIKGITKDVKLIVQFGRIQIDPGKNEKARFSVTGKINRSDWGLTWNAVQETGGLMLSEEVNISCEIELINAN